MKTAKALLAMALILCLLAGLTACTQTPAASQAPGGGTPATTAPGGDSGGGVVIGGGEIEGVAKTEKVDNLVVVMGSATFDPAPFGSVGGRGAFEQMLYAAPIYRNDFTENYDESTPWIAKNVTKVSDVIYDIEIWDNIVDSQGNKFLADDLIWSYGMLVTIGEQIFVGNQIKEWTKVDDYNVRLELEGPAARAIEYVLGYNRIGVCTKDWYERTSADERAVNPATTGPYKIKSIVPGAEIVLEAVEPYWMPEDLRPAAMKQTIKTITMRTITEPAMRSIALENKEADVSAISASELGRFYENGMAKAGYNVQILSSDHYFGYFLNMDVNSGSEVAKNINLRKAILTALKWDDLALAVGQTYETIEQTFTCGVVNGGAYNPEWSNESYWEYDLDLAKQYLADAGFKPGEVTIRYLTRTGATADAECAVVKALLEQVGINVELLLYDQATFNNFKFDSSHWDMIRDNKPGSHMAYGWDDLFNPKGYSNGGMNFIFSKGNDYGYGEQLLHDAVNKTSPETIEAFHDFLIESACAKGLYVTKTFNVAQDGVLTMTRGQGTQLAPAGYVFSEDYKSVLDK